jgi:hypothetical protein
LGLMYRSDSSSQTEFVAPVPSTMRFANCLPRRQGGFASLFPRLDCFVLLEDPNLLNKVRVF